MSPALIDLDFLGESATLIFLAFFVLVLAWVARGGRARYRAASRLPLEDDPSVSRSTRPTPAPRSDD